MTTRDHYMQVARQIANHINENRQAFKTYNVNEFDEMIKAIAGAGSRASGEETSTQLSSALLAACRRDAF